MQHGRDPFRLPGLTDQGHSGFFRGTAPLAVIARDAAGDDVFPCFGAAHHYRDNMIKRQVFRIALLSAILTGVMITSESLRIRFRVYNANRIWKSMR